MNLVKILDHGSVVFILPAVIKRIPKGSLCIFTGAYNIGSC